MELSERNNGASVNSGERGHSVDDDEGCNPSCHVTRSLLITTTTYASPPSMGPARPEAGVLACRSGVSQ